MQKRWIVGVFAIGAVFTSQPVLALIHGLSTHDVQRLKRIKHPVVVPGLLPQGFYLKTIVLDTVGSKKHYHLNYRCFCGGMNYGFTMIGSEQPIIIKQAKKPLRIFNTQLGWLEYAVYDPQPALGFRQSFLSTRPFGKGRFRYQVVSNLQGTTMRLEQFEYVLKHLQFLK